jgi:hypothetical protein
LAPASRIRKRAVADAGPAGQAGAVSRVLSYAGVIAGFFFAGTAGVPAEPVDYTGHYELAADGTGTTFSLDVAQTGTEVHLAFSAAMADGSGAAPDGEGNGRVDQAGVVKLTFKDSFDNAGTGTLVRDQNGFLLKLDASTVNDPRAVRFYGEIPLKKTAAQPSNSN